MQLVPCYVSWIYCRYFACRRKTGKCITLSFFLATSTFILLFYLLFRWNVVCLNVSVQLAVDDLCASFQEGQVNGSLCPALCLDRDIQILSCQPMHKGKSLVFTAQWKNAKVVIKSHKTKDEYIPLQWMSENGTAIFPTPDEFHEMVTHSLRTNCGLIPNSTTNILKILFPFANIPSNLSHNIMSNMWQLIQNNEYVLSIMYQESQIFPKVLGSCGTFYAVEYVTPIDEYSISDLYPDMKPIVQFISKLESMKPETLEVCDVKAGHFGLSRDGLLKILDADTVFVKSVVDRITSDGRMCTSDGDCHLFDCHSSCNRDRNRCDQPLSDTNMQRVCRKIDSNLCI